MITSIPKATYKYYLSMGLWIFKLLVIIFVLIPGTLPLIIGYIVSLLYKLIDPNFAVANFLHELYLSTIGSLPLLVELLIVQLIILGIVSIYLLSLRKKHPGLNWVEISRAEVGSTLEKITRPTNPGRSRSMTRNNEIE